MIKPVSHIVFLLLLLPFYVCSQDYNYVHYDTKDGLAGSTVYDVCQDNEGFIWFGTEYGVSRYDGTKFKNFTVKDGLPDNEVLRVFADNKGRVWIASFSNQLCYYYKNKIYNAGNDSSVAKMKFNKNVFNIFQDWKGNLMFSDFNIIFQLKVNNEVVNITELPYIKYPQRNFFGSYTKHGEDGFFLQKKDSGFKLLKNAVQFRELLPEFSYRVSLLRYVDKDYTISTPANRTTWLLSTSGRPIIINTLSGSWEIDTFQFKPNEHYLPGKIISNSLIDKEGNKWFTSLGEGVFKLPSKYIRTISSGNAGKPNEAEVFSISPHGNRIIGGNVFSRSVVVKNGIYEKLNDYTKYLESSSNPSAYNRLFSMKQLSTGELIMGFDNFLLKEAGNKITFSSFRPIKSIAQMDKDHFLVGSFSCAVKMNIKDLKIVDTIWMGRCTKVFYHNNKYYIGTLNGLYEIEKNVRSRHMGSIHPALHRRINDIIVDVAGTMWIATNDMGIVGYRNGKIVAAFSDTNGLSSNICKTLFSNKNFLWVGNDNGLHKIDISKDNFPLLRFSSSDGLPANTINAIYVADSTVWLGTPSGLVYFNENKISKTSFCRLVMDEVRIGGALTAIKEKYDLSFDDKKISFEYAGISFKSAGEIIYRYKLSGFDTSWYETRSTKLDYQSLPSGNFELQIYAINKFGVRSNQLKIAIKIDSPFWQKWWFYVLISIAVILAIGLLMNRRYRLIRNRLELKSNFEKQVASVEQQALQAQMNPHFIFNCLNSIQQYILVHDTARANQYLTEFASLIRLTLDNSGKRTITVGEEVDYLTRYLQMEKMRFGENFRYTIDVAGDIKAGEVEIPAMLVQPYVENCLRHGIRMKREEMGEIKILFFKSEEQLCCTITDNGIGREKSAELKSHQHIEYQSKGMELTEKRISLINKITNKVISVEVVDLKHNNNEAAGTKVIIKFPFI